MSTTEHLNLKNDFSIGGPADDTWFDTVADNVERARFGYLALDLSGTGNYTADVDTEAPRKVLDLSGTLTGNRVLILPALSGQEWLIINGCSGAFTLTVKVAGQTGIVITQGYRARAWCDGTDIRRGSIDHTNSSGVVLADTVLSGKVSSPPSTAQNLATGNTITLPTGGDTKPLTATGGSVTGIILTAGTVDGQKLALFNKEASNTITFAAAGTSNVADGTSAVLGALRAMSLIWDSASSRWYRA